MPRFAMERLIKSQSQIVKSLLDGKGFAQMKMI